MMPPPTIATSYFFPTSCVIEILSSRKQQIFLDNVSHVGSNVKAFYPFSNPKDVTMKCKPFVIFALFACVSSIALAQQADTLQKIKASGSITIGHRDSSIPFSYVVGGAEPVGFAID